MLLKQVALVVSVAASFLISYDFLLIVRFNLIIAGEKEYTNGKRK